MCWFDFFFFFCNRTKNEMKTFIELHAKSADWKVEDSDGEVWEKVVDTETFKLWRCPVSGSSLYKYKGKLSLLTGTLS